jgi:YesN/AraC family two-component response regulator
MACTKEGCNNKYYSSGLCRKHYRIFLINRDPNTVIHHRNGYKKYPEHQLWWSMRNRCYCKTHKSYKYYGARGIIVCERWLNDFKNFYGDMGKRPSLKHQIDRIDNNGNYEPSNCQWITQLENNRKESILNTESVRELRKDRLDGLSLKEISDKYGINVRYASRVCNNKTWKDVK